MGNQASKTPEHPTTDPVVRRFLRWPLRAIVVGITALGLAAGLAACSDDSGSDPLPLGDSDSGVIVDDPPADEAPVDDGLEDEMEDDG